MSAARQSHGRRRWVAGVAALLTLGLAGCSVTEETFSLPDDYLGQWYYLGSSGGITGGGLGDEATGWIVIDDDNSIAQYDDSGVQVGTESFTLTFGPSIFSEDDVWILTAPSELDRVIQVHPDGAMSIAHNVYDGYQFSYGRSR
jgi:hypothetical protein